MYILKLNQSNSSYKYDKLSTLYPSTFSRFAALHLKSLKTHLIILTSSSSTSPTSLFELSSFSEE